MKSLHSFLIGVAVSTLFSLNVFFWGGLILITSILKIILPFAHKSISKLLVWYATQWVHCNTLLVSTFIKIRWDIQGFENLELTKNKSYLVISNHLSWSDIFVLQHTLRHKIPFLKFFLKQELIWVPILGLVWWALDFPFMKRYSKEYLKKHPEDKGKDILTTRKACEKFREYPISVMNFLEGTRFNYQKHKKQNPPYKYLLKPKAGGIALVLSSMGDYLDSILDVTIVYPNNKPPIGFWQLLSGQIREIHVHVRTRPIPENVVGKNYPEDEEFRQYFQQWVNQVWQEKEDLIKEVHKGLDRDNG